MDRSQTITGALPHIAGASKRRRSPAWGKRWCCVTWPIWHSTHPDIADDLDEPGDGADPVAHFLERSLQADPTDLTAAVALLDRHRSLDNLEVVVSRGGPGRGALPRQSGGAAARCGCGGVAQCLQEGLGLRPAVAGGGSDQHAGPPAYDRAAARPCAQADLLRPPDLAAKSLDEASEWERPDIPNPALRIGRALVATMAATDGDAGAAEKVRAAVAEAGGGRSAGSAWSWKPA